MDRQELNIKVSTNDLGNNSSKNKPDMDVASHTTPLLAQAAESRGPEGGPVSKL